MVTVEPLTIKPKEPLFLVIRQWLVFRITIYIQFLHLLPCRLVKFLNMCRITIILIVDVAQVVGTNAAVNNTPLIAVFRSFKTLISAKIVSSSRGIILP